LKLADQSALADALSRNIHPEAGDAAPSMQALADWMMQAAAALETGRGGYTRFRPAGRSMQDRAG
jgi:hypothetical protein